jgi:hypothetical protein
MVSEEEVKFKDVLLETTIPLDDFPLENHPLGSIPPGRIVGLCSDYESKVSLKDFHAYMGSAYLKLGPWRLEVNAFPGGCVKGNMEADKEAMLQQSVLSGLLRLAMTVKKEEPVALFVPLRWKMLSPLAVKFWFRVIPEEGLAEGGSAGVRPAVGTRKEPNP